MLRPRDARKRAALGMWATACTHTTRGHCTHITMGTWPGRGRLRPRGPRRPLPLRRPPPPRRTPPPLAPPQSGGGGGAAVRQQTLKQRERGRRRTDLCQRGRDAREELRREVVVRRAAHHKDHEAEHLDASRSGPRWLVTRCAHAWSWFHMCGENCKDWIGKERHLHSRIG